MYAWLTFYHQVGVAGSYVSFLGNLIRRLSLLQYPIFLQPFQGHEVAQDFKPYMFDLQHRLQLTRDNFNINFESAEKLRNKMLEVNSIPYNCVEDQILRCYFRFRTEVRPVM